MVLDAPTVIVLIIGFAWSGFVRAGLGFGGAGLMYPIALLVVDSVLFLVPLVCVQVLVFSIGTLIRDHRLINWRVLRWLMAVLVVPFFVGVLGLVTLPEFAVLMMVYTVITIYALGYIFRIESATPRAWVELPALLVGGYVSGLSLAGAPLIAAVVGKRLQRHEFRATLFVLWPTLVVIKLATLVSFGVDLQLQHQAWLLPSALVGHVLGMRAHDYLLTRKTDSFYTWLGVGLLLICAVGIARHLL